MSRRAASARALAQVVALHEDAERCAAAAGLKYVSPTDPGIRRLRHGRGFRYLDENGAPVSAAVRREIERLAIPPAWRDVWICPSPEGHLRAVGEDDRGRRQYLYHEHWRTFRDELNFHRLVDFGARLPAVRTAVEAGLRRRALDRDLVRAAMLRILDRTGIRVGTEEYAQDNDSYGLTTLHRRHVQVRGRQVTFSFPAKSGKHATRALADPAVARVVRALAERRGRRLFSLADGPIDADELNEHLAALAGARVTAKDFRTWHGTRIAFAFLRARFPPPGDPEQRVLAAVDEAADFLGNTRAVARSHYVHPQVLRAYVDGSFGELMAAALRNRGLDADERALLPFLRRVLEREISPA